MAHQETRPTSQRERRNEALLKNWRTAGPLLVATTLILALMLISAPFGQRGFLGMCIILLVCGFVAWWMILDPEAKGKRAQWRSTLFCMCYLYPFFAIVFGVLTLQRLLVPYLTEFQFFTGAFITFTAGMMLSSTLAGQVGRREFRHVRAEVQRDLVIAYLALFGAVVTDEQKISVPSDVEDDEDEELTDIPRLCVVHEQNQWRTFAREDLPTALREQLLRLPPKEAFDSHDEVLRLLESGEDDVLAERVYLFPEVLDEIEYRDVVRLRPKHDKLLMQFEPGFDLLNKAVFATVVGGRIAAICMSAHDDTTVIDEAWLSTQSDFRGQSYARQAVLAWANFMSRQKAIPLFSHRIGDAEKSSVAQSLYLIHCFDVVMYY